MKKFVLAVLFSAVVYLPVHAQESALPAATGNDAVDQAELEKYMESAIEQQLMSMRSTLPMKVSPGVVWKDVELKSGNLNYVYQINIDEMVASMPKELRDNLDEQGKQEVLKQMKTGLCPQIKPMLCISLDLMSTFSPKMQHIAATYLEANDKEFTKCDYSLDSCADVLKQFNDQKASAAE